MTANRERHRSLPLAPQASSVRRPGPSLGSGSDRQKIALAIKQKAARDVHWKLVRTACDSEDHKEFSKDTEWRKELIQAHSSLLEACDGTHDKLEQATDIIRSMHPGRAQIYVNPTQVAIALQPAVEDGSVTQDQADTMVKIVTEGIRVEEFGDLLGGSTDSPVWTVAVGDRGPQHNELSLTWGSMYSLPQILHLQLHWSWEYFTPDVSDQNNFAELSHSEHNRIHSTLCFLKKMHTLIPTMTKREVIQRSSSIWITFPNTMLKFWNNPTRGLSWNLN